MRLEAKKITECDVDTLWRGRLDVELLVMAMIDQQIKQIDKALEGLVDEKVRLLMGVPGVGIGLATTVVVHLDDPARFSSAGKVGAYAGLTPRQDQSGESNRFGHITRRGPSLLRGMLIEVAWVVYRHNQWARDFVNRVSRGSEREEEDCDCSLGKKTAGQALGNAARQQTVAGSRPARTGGGGDCVE